MTRLNARPTQPGYYWARQVCGAREWEPCDLCEYDGRQWASFLGDEREYDPNVGIEWGPAIPEYRGDGSGDDQA